MTQEEAVAELRELREALALAARRDEIIRAVKAAGLNHSEISRESGVKRPTVIRIVKERDMGKYMRITADEVPSGARFVVPRPNQGQLTETAYSTGRPAGNADACDGDPYMRITDEEGKVTYWRLEKQDG